MTRQVVEMSDRICAECGVPIAEKAQVLFCSRYCSLQYLSENDDVPAEPVVA